MGSVLNHPMWGSEEWCGGSPNDDVPARTGECEEEGHRPEDDDKPVHEYRVLDEEEGGRYSMWFCATCAEAREVAGWKIECIGS